MKKSEDKFIPDCYIFNSRKVRLNVLKGIMDSDGFVDSNGIPIIGVASKRLADNIAFLARSLGYNCTQSIKPSGYKKDGKYIKCLDSHIVRIYTNDRIFNLERKNQKLTKFESNYSRSNRDFSTIINIEYSHKEKCKCVTVDNASHCYLIGDFVTTHNSKSLTMAAIMAKYFVLGESTTVNQSVKCMATAYQKQYLTSDGILNKFQSYIDFLA
jgi:replicative DNA helicase